jgi:hypothetical protein
MLLNTNVQDGSHPYPSSLQKKNYLAQSNSSAEVEKFAMVCYSLGLDLFCRFPLFTQFLLFILRTS